MSAIYLVTLPLAPNSSAKVTERVKAADVADAALAAYSSIKAEFPKSTIQWPTSVRLVEVRV